MNEKGKDESLENPSIDINEGSQEVKMLPSLDIVKPNTLLIHKTRTKSVARPPSKEFLKTTVLRSSSMDLEDDKVEHKSVKRTSSEHVSNSITTHVHETKQQSFSSIATNKVIVEDITSRWQNISLKKTAGVSKPSKVNDGPSWLKEFRERKTRKTLKGDEFVDNSERERHTVVEVNVSKKPNNEEVIFKSDNKVQTVPSKDEPNTPRPTIVEDQYNLSESKQSTKLGDNIGAITLPMGSESSKAIENVEINDLKRHRKDNVDAMKASVQSVETSKSRDNIETTTTKQLKEITQMQITDGVVKSGSSATTLQRTLKTMENIRIVDSKKDKDENINEDPIKVNAQSIETFKTGYNVKEIKNESTLISKEIQKEESEEMKDDSDEKIKNFEVRFQNFQKKIIDNVQSLETLITNEFENQIKEFEEIKTVLLKKNK